MATAQQKYAKKLMDELEWYRLRTGELVNDKGEIVAKAGEPIIGIMEAALTERDYK